MVRIIIHDRDSKLLGSTIKGTISPKTFTASAHLTSIFPYLPGTQEVWFALSSLSLHTLVELKAKDNEIKRLENNLGYLRVERSKLREEIAAPLTRLLTVATEENRVKK